MSTVGVQPWDRDRPGREMQEHQPTHTSFQKLKSNQDISYSPEQLDAKSSRKNVKECSRNLEAEDFLEDASRGRDLEGKVMESFAY